MSKAKNEDAMLAQLSGGELSLGSFDAGALAQSLQQDDELERTLYLKFLDGEWTYGGGMEADVDALWAVHPGSFGFGYQEKCGIQFGTKLLKPAGQPVSKDELEPTLDTAHKDWNIAILRAAQFVCLEGIDENMTMVFESSSQGGSRALQELINKVSRKAQKGDRDVVPVVRLKGSSYMNKTYNKEIHTPVFELVHWDTMSLEKTKTLIEERLTAPE